jgi:hypothetical protein
LRLEKSSASTLWGLPTPDERKLVPTTSQLYVRPVLLLLNTVSPSGSTACRASSDRCWISGLKRDGCKEESSATETQDRRTVDRLEQLAQCGRRSPACAAIVRLRRAISSSAFLSIVLVGSHLLEVFDPISDSSNHLRRSKPPDSNVEVDLVLVKLKTFSLG